MTAINTTEAREKARRVGFALRELVNKGARGTEHTEQLARTIQGNRPDWLPALRWDGVDAVLAWWFHSRGLPVGDHLKAAATRAASNQEAALKQFQELHQALQAAGVDVLPLKGVALVAGGFAPHASARGTSDVDCLIHEADREKAQRAMEGLKYEVEPVPANLPPYDPFAPHKDHYRRRDALPVELHWRLLPPAVHGGDADDFWKNTAASQHGITVPTARPMFRHAILAGSMARNWAAFTWRGVLDFIWAQGKDLGWGTHREREFQRDVAWLQGNDAVEPSPIALAPWRAWVAAQPWPMDRQGDVMALGIQAAMGDAGDVAELRRQGWYLPPAERGGLAAPFRRARQRLSVERIIRTAQRLCQ